MQNVLCDKEIVKHAYGFFLEWQACNQDVPENSRVNWWQRCSCICTDWWGMILIALMYIKFSRKQIDGRDL